MDHQENLGCVTNSHYSSDRFGSIWYVKWFSLWTCWMCLDDDLLSGHFPGLATRHRRRGWLLCHQTRPRQLSQPAAARACASSRHWGGSGETAARGWAPHPVVRKTKAFDKEADRQWVANAAAKLGLLLNEAGDEPFEATEEMCFEDDLPVPLEENEDSSIRDPFARFDTQIRITPTIFGMIGLGVLILNRQSLVFSEAPVPQKWLTVADGHLLKIVH